MYDNDMYGNDGYRPHLHGSPLARVSFLLGILSLMSCMVIYIAVPLGALAVIFALLSRTDSPKSKKCRASIICGICGMVLTTVITWTAFYKVFTDPEMFGAIEYYMQMYTGDSDLDLRKELGSRLPFLKDTPALKNDTDTDGNVSGNDPFTDDNSRPASPFINEAPLPDSDNGGGFI